MIWHFPFPYEDELFYSVVARYSERMPYPDQKRLGFRLFGLKDASASVEFPSRISHLIRLLPPGHPAASESIIEDHTLFSWYAPFMSEQKADILRHAILHGRGARKYLISGIAAFKVLRPTFFRYCPTCFQNDLAEHRELYWRRLHQLTGVEVCPHHNVFLECSSCLMNDSVFFRRYWKPSPDLITVTPRHVCLDREDHRLLIWIATQAKLLLKVHYHSIGPEEIRHRYILRFGKQGFLSPQGRVLLAELHKSIEYKFGEQSLRRLGCGWTSNQTRSFVARLVHKPFRSQAPIRHLILLAYLGITVDEFLTGSGEQQTMRAFERTQCPNTLCSEFGKPISLPIERVYSHRLRGFRKMLTCSTCGYKFTEWSEKKSQTVIHIVDRGLMWRSKLAALWADPNISLRQIAQILGVHRMTLKREAFKSGLAFPRYARVTTTKSGLPLKLLKRKRNRIEKLRTQWRSLLIAFPQESTQQLRYKRPDVYSALYRLDRNWLFANRHPAVISKKEPGCVWFLRDVQSSRKLFRLLQEIDDNPSLPFSLTKTRLTKAIEAVGWLKQRTCKMKGLRLVLAAVSETGLEGARRRIRQVVAFFKQRGVQITPYQLKRAASINRNLLRFPIVGNEIIAGCRELSLNGSIRVSGKVASTLLNEYLENLQLRRFESLVHQKNLLRAKG